MDGGFLCLLVVVGIVVFFIYNANQKAGNRFRIACGECGYQSGWTTESAAQADAIRHYQDRHPSILPGGTIQFRGR